MIDLRYVKKLLEMLDESTVDSLEISSDKGMKIRLRKTTTPRAPMYAAPQMMHAPAPQMIAAPAVAPAAAAPAPAAAPAKASNLSDVKSPMVGTYYGAP